MDAQQFANQLFNAYDDFKETKLSHRRFKHADIVPLIEKLSEHDDFKVVKAGKSVEEKDIFHITYGQGDIVLLLWSQMHGDEATATMALFDLFNFLSADHPAFSDFRAAIKNKLSIHFIPMLNPDGADRFQRRNAMNVDLNRDAQKLEFPESQVLKKVRDETQADFGFNLHDQSKYYNVALTENTAALSFLAPAYDYEKGINGTREKAMQLIAVMNETVQQFLPGHVGRYNDDFEPRAFGDNIQKWGTSTILVEAGGIRGDEEKQLNRKVHFCLLLSAFISLADGSYSSKNVAAYEAIPKNDRKMADLILRNVELTADGKTKSVDISFKSDEVQNDDATAFYNKGYIDDIGDLSTFYGYTEFDAGAYSLKKGKLGEISDPEDIDQLKCLKKRYGDLLWPGIKNHFKYKHFDVNIHERKEEMEDEISPGKNPSLFLVKEGKIRYAIVNAKLIKVQ